MCAEHILEQSYFEAKRVSILLNHNNERMAHFFSFCLNAGKSGTFNAYLLSSLKNYYKGIYKENLKKSSMSVFV